MEILSTAFLALVSAFGLVLAVELPDKTLVATLVLTTQYRALPVFAGVCAAFAVQCVIAVLFGSVLTTLPDRLVAMVVAVLFGVGAFFLLRDGFAKSQDSYADAVRSGPEKHTFVRAALSSFGVLFAAEWGDASQLATAGLTAHYGQALAVGIGSFLALVLVAGIAVLIGQKLRNRLRPALIQRAAGPIFLALAAIAAWQALP